MPMKTCKTLAQDRIPILDNPELEDRITMTPELIEERVRPWLRVLDTGNTYAASTLIATCDILDHAKPGENILAVSYGSGAYTIATWLHVEDAILGKRGRTPTVRDYLNRRRDISLESYRRLVRFKQHSVRSKLEMPRIVAEVEPYNGKTWTYTLCNGCHRVFYPARDRCLEFDCNGPVEQQTLPVNARLLSMDKPTMRETFTSNFELLKEGKVLIVDAAASELIPGMELESVIRRLDEEGKSGLIIYGPVYRPVFRTKALLRETEARAEPAKILAT
jgi:uncharacterized OB-fold protein